MKWGANIEVTFNHIQCIFFIIFLSHLILIIILYTLLYKLMGESLQYFILQFSMSVHIQFSTNKPRNTLCFLCHIMITFAISFSSWNRALWYLYICMVAVYLHSNAVELMRACYEYTHIYEKLYSTCKAGPYVVIYRINPALHYLGL